MKYLFVFAISMITSIAAFAQLGGDGFYRVRNVATDRYVTIENDKSSGLNFMTQTADMSSISLVKDCDDTPAHSNPANVIYVSKHDDKYDFEAQGTGVNKLIDYYVSIAQKPDGSYRAYATKSGVTLYLGDEREAGSDRGLISTDKNAAKDWYIEPISSDNDNYAGVVPTVQALDGKYMTYYVSYTYSFASAGMQAYAITKFDPEFSCAVIEEVQGVIPAATPVIIKCAGDASSDNRLNLGGTATASVSSVLDGTYFNKANGNKTNLVVYNENTMRVLGTDANGNLAFVVGDETNTYSGMFNIATNNDGLGLPVGTQYRSIFANTAYLTVPEGSPSTIQIVTAAEYEQLKKQAEEEKKEEEEQKQREEANQRAYERLSAQLDRAAVTLDSIVVAISAACDAGIGLDYILYVQELQSMVDDLSVDLDAKYAAVALTDESTINTDDIIAKGMNALEEAKQAQAEYNSQKEEEEEQKRQEELARQEANQRAYDRLSAQLTEATLYVQSVRATISETCIKEIADYYDYEIAELCNMLDMMSNDLHASYVAVTLTDDSTVNTDPIVAKAQETLAAALQAQAKHDEEIAAIGTLSSSATVISRTTLQGTPVLGSPRGVVIERLSDGTIRKVRY